MNNNFKQRGLKVSSAAKILAINSYTQFLDRYPIIEKVNSKHWDFVLTIAGVFVAISQLNHENISKKEKDNILDIITKSVLEIYPDGVDACEDCRKFVDRTYDGLVTKTEYKENPEYLFSDSLGGWIVWNLFGHSPSDEEEGKLTRVLGGFLVHSFISWWK